MRWAILFLFLFTFSACTLKKQNIPTPYQIQITGQDYEWHILYPGKDGQLYTDDDLKNQQHLNLPYNTEIELILKSEDYLYFIEFPQFNQIGMAVSEQTHHIRFKPHQTGTYDLRGSQMCAYTHEKLLGKLHIYKPFWFSFWQNRL